MSASSSLQNLILPMHPPLRWWAKGFTNCHYLHIPAIEHGFATAHLFIQPFTTKGVPIFGVQITLDPCTYLVKLAFISRVFAPDAPREARLTFALMPPQSGTVVITGPCEG